MSADAPSGDFVLTVTGVFSLTGRGTAVTGTIESGALRTGETIGIWDGGRLVATATATIDLLCGWRAGPPGIGLLLGDIDKNLLSAGQVIRKPAGAPGMR